MADDPDALWRPGNDDPLGFDRGAPADFAASADSSAPSASTPWRRWRGPRPRLVAGVIAVALAAAVLVVALDDGAGRSGAASTGGAATTTVLPEPVVLPRPERSIVDEERAARFDDAGGDVILAAGDVPVSMGPAVCLHERLPATATARWSMTLDAVAVDGRVHVADDVAVIPAVVETGFRSRTDTVLIGLDLDDGSERWRTATTGEAVSIVGWVDDVLIGNVWFIGSERSRQLTAWSLETGVALWTLELGPGDQTVLEPDSGLLGVHRSELVLDEITDRQFAFPEFAVLEPATGELVAVRSGRFDTMTSSGLLVTRDVTDLAYGDLGPDDEGFSRFSMVRVADLPAAVVGRSVVRTSRSLDVLQRWLPEPAEGERVRELRLTGSVRIDPPPIVDRLVGLDDSSVVLAGGGSVHGANVGESVVEIRWRVDGTLVSDAPSDRGRTLVVRRDGGRLQRIVDSSTGRTILDVASVGNEVSSSDLLANGVIARSGVGSDSMRRAIDLDGRTMWTLPGSGRLAVGDRVVLDWHQVVDDAGEEALDIAAFGPLDDGPPSCTTANESFQGFPS